MSRRRIMIVTSSLGLGGAEKHIVALCDEYRSRGAACSVLYLPSGKDKLVSEIRDAGAEPIPFPLDSLTGLLIPSRPVRLRRLVRQFGPDLIHAHLYHGEVIGALCSFFSGAPLLATRHSFGLEFNGARERIVRFLKARYSGIIAVSEDASKEAKAQGFSPEMVSVIPNGVDTGLFRPLAGEKRRLAKEELVGRLFGGKLEGPFIGSMGSLKSVKDHALLIEAVKSAGEEGDSAATGAGLVIMGEGPERASLTMKIEESGMSERVAMPGIEQRPWDVLPLLDIFVLSSRSEGIPIALLEAMACSVACISTEVGGVGGILKGAGVLVPPGDAEALARAIRRLADDPDERQEVAARCRARAVSSYDLGAWGTDTWNFLEKVHGG